MSAERTRWSIGLRPDGRWGWNTYAPGRFWGGIENDRESAEAAIREALSFQEDESCRVDEGCAEYEAGCVEEWVMRDAA